MNILERRADAVVLTEENCPELREARKQYEKNMREVVIPQMIEDQAEQARFRRKYYFR